MPRNDIDVFIFMKRRILKFLIALVLFFAASFCFALTKVACVGDSITAGSGIKNPAKDSYPAVLGVLLGGEYEVKNFGVSGRTLLNSGDFPYMKEKKYAQSLEFAPDIVIIKLGTNDSKPQNWKHKAEFEADFKKLVKSYQDLPSKPKIIIATQMYVAKSAWGITNKVVEDEVMPLTLKLAKELGLPVIDFYAAFDGRADLLCDGVHPNEAGARKMAEICRDKILGK